MKGITMKLIKTFAIATVLVTAAIGQSNPGAGQSNTGGQPTASPSPTPVNTAPAAKGQTTPAAANKPAGTKTAPSTKASPATKASPSTKTSPAGNSATKTAPGTMKSGTITPAAGAKTQPDSKQSATAQPVATHPAATPSAAHPAATQSTVKPASSTTAVKPGTQAQPAKSANTVPPTKTAAAAPTTKSAAGAPGAKKALAAPDTKKVAAKTTAPKTAVTKKVPVTKPAKPVKAAVVEPTPAPPLEKKGPAKLMGAAGRRDPFISPIRAVSSGTPTGNCTSGKRCLAIPELMLQGTVRDISGKMMAIVVTSNHRTYTLRENDQVFNGSVEKITSDSIIFREFVRDAVGRESAREVVKKLSPTS